MKLTLDSVIPFFHATRSAVLATHGLALPGYPYASVLSFAPDQDHCPLFLISQLAEHTRNLRADPRASLLLQLDSAQDPESSARLTVIGEVKPVEASAARQARYLRYLPAAGQYLALGDFSFFRFQPRRLRLVAGFGRMGWLEENEWADCPVLTTQQEDSLLADVSATHNVVGIDCFGVDRLHDGRRQRLSFDQALTVDQIRPQLIHLGLIG